VVIDQHLLWSFIGWCHIRREKWSIDYDPDNFMGLVSEGVREFAEVLCVVDWQVAEQESAMSGELLRIYALICLKRLYCIHYFIKTWLGTLLGT
jgi:hypothetical protein